MENINIELFLQEWNKIEAKLEAIRGMSPLFTSLKDFDGVEIGGTWVTYKTQEYYSGCGWENDGFHIMWDDINKPIEYFRQLCEEAKDKKAAQLLKEQEEINKRRTEEEKQKLKELQAKYGINP